MDYFQLRKPTFFFLYRIEFWVFNIEIIQLSKLFLVWWNWTVFNKQTEIDRFQPSYESDSFLMNRTELDHFKTCRLFFFNNLNLTVSETYPNWSSSHQSDNTVKFRIDEIDCFWSIGPNWIDSRNLCKSTSSNRTRSFLRVVVVD